MLLDPCNARTRVERGLPLWVVLVVGTGCSYDLPEIAPGPGTDYHVDATGGDDANPGTAALPWRSLARVNAGTFVPGDRILLRRGETWAESITPPSSGTSAAPIVFGAYGSGDRPRITGAPNKGCIQWSQARSHLVFRDLHLYRCGQPGGTNEGGINVWSDAGPSTDIVIEGCLIEEARTWSIYLSGLAQVVIRDNTLDASESGINIDGALATDDVVVEGNEIHGHNDMCIHVSAATGVILRRNRIHDCALGGVNNVGAPDLLAHHNLIHGAMAGIYNACDSPTMCASGGVYHHNTIVVTGSGGCIETTAEASFAEIENNICVHQGSGGVLLGSGQTTGKSDHNLFFGPSSVGFDWGGASYGTLAGYQAASGQDSHSKHADPLFVSAATGDYHLSAGSPAVDLGPSLGYATDLDGNPMPAGAGADAGAFERQ